MTSNHQSANISETDKTDDRIEINSSHKSNSSINYINTNINEMNNINKNGLKDNN